jgi:hypothetical protein
MTNPIVMKRQSNEEFGGELSNLVSGFICPFTGVPCTTIPTRPAQSSENKQDDANSKVS